ncbi:MAG: hypothetical protein ABL994_18310, partial [Verrucomicrobiales bacterium]
EIRSFDELALKYTGTYERERKMRFQSLVIAGVGFGGAAERGTVFDSPTNRRTKASGSSRPARASTLFWIRLVPIFPMAPTMLFCAPRDQPLPLTAF